MCSRRTLKVKGRPLGPSLIASQSSTCKLIQERIADAAMNRFASTCRPEPLGLPVARRNGYSAPQTNHAADLFLRQSFRRIRRFLSDLSDNDEKALLATANAALGQDRSK